MRNSSAYRYDAVDVARQVLSNRSRVLLPQVKAAYEAGERALFGRLTGTWLHWMDLLDDLPAASGRHLLGRWLADARSPDGVTWTTVGTATPGGAAAAQDVGVFMTAANGWNGARGHRHVRRIHGGLISVTVTAAVSTPRQSLGNSATRGRTARSCRTTPAQHDHAYDDPCRRQTKTSW